MQKRCPRCGTMAPVSAAACGQCGRFYQTTAPRPPAPAYAPPAYAAPVPLQEPVVRPWWHTGWFFGGLVLGLLFGVPSVFWFVGALGYAQRLCSLLWLDTHPKRVSALTGAALGANVRLLFGWPVSQ